MARVKRTERKVFVSTEKKTQEEKEESKEEKGKSRIPPKARERPTARKRMNYQVKSLREIREAQKSTCLLIPRLPFMRVVRDISDRLMAIIKGTNLTTVRWQSSALMCIQEAAEDFLIDFMNDGYIAAAFAHRVTLMSKDFVLVSRLRYKFDRALEPIPSQDRKAFEILNIPPARRPKSTVKIEDVTHQYSTRKSEDFKEEKKKYKEKEKLSEDAILSERAEILHLSNALLFENVTGQMVVNVSLVEDEEVYLDIAPEDSKMLVDHNIEISETVLFICLRCLLSDLPVDSAKQIFILDPLVSACLFNKQGELSSFFRGFDMLTCNYMMYPYAENGHWSLIIFSLLERNVIFNNSLASIHGRCKIAAKLILSFLATTFADYKLEDFKFFSQKVPLQKDSTSCGWMVLANAWRFIESKFRMTTLTLHEYSDSWVSWVREKAVSLILERSINPYDPDSPVPKKKGKDAKKRKGRNKAKYEIPVEEIPLKEDEDTDVKSKDSKKGPPFHSPLRFKIQNKRSLKQKRRTEIGSPFHIGNFFKKTFKATSKTSNEGEPPNNDSNSPPGPPKEESPHKEPISPPLQAPKSPPPQAYKSPPLQAFKSPHPEKDFKYPVSSPPLPDTMKHQSSQKRKRTSEKEQTSHARRKVNFDEE